MNSKDLEIEEFFKELDEKRNAKIKASKNKEKENLHAGHRERVKEDYLLRGLETLYPHQVLEFLLYFVLPNCDTNEIAHRLINKAGSFPAVFDLSIDELQTVPGIKKHAATFLKSIPEVSRYYFESYSKRILSPQMKYEDIGEYAVNFFIGENKEKLMAFYFDSNMHLLGEKVVGKGTASTVSFSLFEITDSIVNLGAANVVIAHNHLTKALLPSFDDQQETKRVHKTLENLGVNLVEHFIVSGDSYLGIRKFLEDNGEEYKRTLI